MTETNQQLEKEIEEIISKSPVKSDPVHSKTTRDWVLKLKPNAGYALQIAALSHDIERSFNGISAEIITNLLKKYKYTNDFVEKVKNLVLNHEWGGSTETDILTNADSISFFEGNLEGYFEKFGEEKTRYKIKARLETMSQDAKDKIKSIRYKSKILNEIITEML